MNLSVIFTGSIVLIIQYYARQYIESDINETFPPKPIDYSLPQIETYDFIIVGGGNAGSVIARRLSEKKEFNVLVLEAGGYPPPQMTVPACDYRLVSIPELTFQYKTVDQDDLGNPIKSYRDEEAKCLGGSTSLGSYQYNRGSSYDYDNWARITGDISWTYKNVIKYFKKVEKYYGNYSNDLYGSDGPIPISTQQWVTGYDTFMKAGAELGYTINGNPNDGLTSIPIFTTNEFTSRKGRGINSYKGYLWSFEGERKNLKIIKYAYVNEITFDENPLRANGVYYIKHGVQYYVQASKEIILSAGVYGSPTILLKSGIGPEQDLKPLGIITRMNLPVGKYLQQRPYIRSSFIVNDSSETYIPSRDFTEQAVELYLKKGKGPLVSTCGMMGQVYLTTTPATTSGISNEYTTNWPNTKISFPSMGVLTQNPKEIIIKIGLQIRGTTNTGTLKLNPLNISNPPLIDPKVFINSNDIMLYIQGMKETIKIFETKTYSKIGGRFDPGQLLNCGSYIYGTNDYWTCYLKEIVGITQDGTGTCRMGKQNDPMAVIDSKFRVLGVKGLRVIDSSIMPEITVSNPMAPVYMFGEKGATNILTQWFKNKNKKNM